MLVASKGRSVVSTNLCGLGMCLTHRERALLKANHGPNQVRGFHVKLTSPFQARHNRIRIRSKRCLWKERCSRDKRVAAIHGEPSLTSYSSHRVPNEREYHDDKWSKFLSWCTIRGVEAPKMEVFEDANGYRGLRLKEDAQEGEVLPIYYR
jgi:hypothetical protein